MRTRRAPKSPGILMCVSLRKYASGSTQGCQSMGPRFNLCHGPEIRWALFWTDVPSCVKSTLHLSTAGVEILNEQRERPVAHTNTTPETRHVKPFIKWTYLIPLALVAVFAKLIFVHCTYLRSICSHQISVPGVLLVSMPNMH